VPAMKELQVCNRCSNVAGAARSYLAVMLCVGTISKQDFVSLHALRGNESRVNFRPGTQESQTTQQERTHE